MDSIKLQTFIELIVRMKICKLEIMSLIPLQQFTHTGIERQYSPAKSHQPREWLGAYSCGGVSSKM
jgi:hypothetical protein